MTTTSRAETSDHAARATRRKTAARAARQLVPRLLLPVLLAGATACTVQTTTGVAASNGMPSRGPTEAAELFGTDWVFVAIAGYDGPLPTPAPVAGFNITKEGRRMTGTTACNRMSSGYEVDFETGRLRFTSLRNTRMLCDRVAADTEEEVLEVMIATDSFRIVGGHLELYANGRLLARLQPGA